MVTFGFELETFRGTKTNNLEEGVAPVFTYSIIGYLSFSLFQLRAVPNAKSRISKDVVSFPTLNIFRPIALTASILY